MMTFDKLGLAEPLLLAIKETGYTTPTPIQAKAIPVVLEGKDVLGGAQTGTGKTAAFVLPMLQRLSEQEVNPKYRKIRALILAPTRELAVQVEASIKKYAAHLSIKSAVIFGGVKIEAQIHKLERGFDVLVATPGRLLDHVERKTVNLSQVEILIMDEADRMLDMGFIRDIQKILAILPKKRQNLLFSATYSTGIKALADKLLKSPVEIEIPRESATAERIKQLVHHVEKARKRELLSYLIGSENWKQVLVFARTKHGADRLTKQLIEDGLNSIAIHGNKSQGARTRALSEFKEGKVRVLVATDVAARGLDINQLPHVINYELPDVAEDYVHRIGRTGRAGNEGVALSLVSGDEVPRLREIEQLIKDKIPEMTVPGFESHSRSKTSTAKSSTNKKPAAEEEPKLRHRRSRILAEEERPARARAPRDDARRFDRTGSSSEDRPRRGQEDRDSSRGFGRAKPAFARSTPKDSDRPARARPSRDDARSSDRPRFNEDRPARARPPRDDSRSFDRARDERPSRSNASRDDSRSFGRAKPAGKDSARPSRAKPGFARSSSRDDTRSFDRDERPKKKDGERVLSRTRSDDKRPAKREDSRALNRSPKSGPRPGSRKTVVKSRSGPGDRPSSGGRGRPASKAGPKTGDRPARKPR